MKWYRGCVFLIEVLLVLAFAISCGNKTPQSRGTDNTETHEEETALSDMDIITREGHPTYYGSVKQSHDVWDDVEKGKIHFADGIYGHDDNPILSMGHSLDKSIITSVYIDFSSFADTREVSLDNTLQIAASYLPFEIMDNYYEYGGSEKIVPDNADSLEGTYYHVLYRLIDEKADKRSPREIQLSGSIDIFIQVVEDHIKSLEIRYSQPKWMFFLEKNEYHREAWECDLYSYRE